MNNVWISPNFVPTFVLSELNTSPQKHTTMDFGYIPTKLNDFTTPVFRGACPSNYIVRDSWQDDPAHHVDRITVTVSKQWGGTYETSLHVYYNDRPGTLTIYGFWDSAKDARTHYKTLCKLFIKILSNKRIIASANKFIQTTEPGRQPHYGERV